jgi:Flp pilus assembly protein CpaB
MSTRKAPSRRRAGLPFIIGGAVLAVATFGGVLFYTTSLTGTSAGDTPVVVAARDIQIRIPITPADLMVSKFHVSDVPPGSFARIGDVKAGLVAAVAITKGQAVTDNLLLNSSDVVIGPQSAYLPIPTGYVALTIPTSEQQGVGGYIQVGDYLSLVANVAGKTSKNIRTIYTNVHVIRVGAAASDTAPVQGTTNNPPKQGGLSNSLTVVVTQCQAEYIGWFIANGSLTYTLESYHDYSVQPAAADPACPNVTAAKGVTQTDVSARWPGLLN